MKICLRSGCVALALLSTLIAQPATILAQGTAFTYQGRLNSGTNAAAGIYDLRFTTYDSAGAGTLIAGPLTNSATGVTNGLFIVTLDFGASFAGADRWLEIGVRTNGSGTFTTLSPRQKVTPVPYAVYSAGAGVAGSAGSVAAGNIVGTLAPAQLPPNVPLLGGNVTFGTVTASGFAGNGMGLTNVPLTQLNSYGAVTSSFAVPFGFTFAGAPVSPVRASSFTLADVNGDGRLDLICAEGFNVAVLTNDGSGTFTLANTNPAGDFPISVVAADVNGDGRMDLIAANYNDSTVTVLTNRGNGTFASAGTPATGVGPNAVTAADVNGDGRMDLITGNYGLTDTNFFGTGRTLTVLTNAGNSSFLLAGSPDVGAASYVVVAADVNGDGRMDLISLDGDIEELVVLTNTGPGTFVPASTNAVSGGSDVVAMDVNGDGRPDLLVSSLDSTVFVLTNSGGGTFTLAGSPSVAPDSFSVAVADVNNDGWPDLICPSFTTLTHMLTVLTNDGTGNFFPARTNDVAAKPYLVMAADLNGDGWVDLINSHLSTNLLTVLTNSPQGRIIQFTGSFTGDAAGLTNFNINVSDLTSGTLADARLSANVALLDADQAFSGLNNFSNPANDFAGIFNGTFFGSFSGGFLGNGAGLDSLNASKLASGTVADARLSANVALLNGNQTFSGANTFSNPANSFAGNGNALTSLNATNLTGSVPVAALVSVPASSLTGTLADARLSANVALLNSNQTFTGLNLFNNGLTVRGPMNITNTGSGLGVVLQGAGNSTAYYIDDTNGERAAVALAAFAGHFSANAGPGDMIVRAISGKVLLQSGGSSAAIVITTNNNVGIGTGSPTNKLHVVGGATFTSGNAGANQSVVWIPGSASWSFTSDRNTKERIEPVNPQSVLERLARLRIAEWSYIGYDQRHIGPMAQDFHAQFPLNGDDKSLNDADLHGVALAAIQGLNQKLEEKDAEIQQLEQRLDQLEQRLNAKQEGAN